MIHPLVSIIVPIYKVEPYLRRCIDSITSQTYTNLEIILVDDGSPDNCPQICDEYAGKDKRIVVVHKKNGGLSEARNVGLDICKGEYISFVDSDDWVNEKYIEKLLCFAAKENADIIIGENIRTEGNSKLPRESVFIKAYTSKEALHHLFGQNHIAFTVSWGKLYKRTLFKSVRFPVGKFYEDQFTTYILFYNAKKIIYTSEILYLYYQRIDSIMASGHPWDALDCFEQRYLFFKEKKETDLLPYLLTPLCWQLLCAYWQESINNRTGHNYLIKLKNYMQDFKHVHHSLFHFVSLTIFSHMPQLYLLYRKFSPLHIRKEF